MSFFNLEKHEHGMHNKLEHYYKRLISKIAGEETSCMDGAFWNAVDKLVAESEIVIDRPKGSPHPRYPNFLYKVDYGYLKNTTAMDGGGIDIWVGTKSSRVVDAIMCIIDLTKRDSEIKILIGCTEQEKEIVYQTHNETEHMKGIMIRR